VCQHMKRYETLHTVRPMLPVSAARRWSARVHRECTCFLSTVPADSKHSAIPRRKERRTHSHREADVAGVGLRADGVHSAKGDGLRQRACRVARHVAQPVPMQRLHHDSVGIVGILRLPHQHHRVACGKCHSQVGWYLQGAWYASALGISLRRGGVCVVWLPHQHRRVACGQGIVQLFWTSLSRKSRLCAGASSPAASWRLQQVQTLAFRWLAFRQPAASAQDLHLDVMSAAWVVVTFTNGREQILTAVKADADDPERLPRRRVGGARSRLRRRRRLGSVWCAVPAAGRPLLLLWLLLRRVRLVRSGTRMYR